MRISMNPHYLYHGEPAGQDVLPKRGRTTPNNFKRHGKREEHPKKQRKKSARKVADGKARCEKSQTVSQEQTGLTQTAPRPEKAGFFHLRRTEGSKCRTAAHPLRSDTAARHNPGTRYRKFFSN